MVGNKRFELSRREATDPEPVVSTSSTNSPKLSHEQVYHIPGLLSSLKIKII